MKLLFLLLLAGSSVMCDGNNYYVVEMEDDSLYKDTTRPFKVYWNVPTMQCRSKKIPFGNLFERYGILQNEGDNFRGEIISILYDPGLFPALLKNESSGKFKFRNGGVPQEGDIERHLTIFRTVLEQSIPDKEFKGAGIIDFESWRPVFRQNFGVLMPYKDVSYEIEKKLHWWWPTPWVHDEAKKRFEDSARTFMHRTLSLAKQIRPHAVWGYYGFPYCFNVASNNMKESCADKVSEENDRLNWLWEESSALYPSVYSSKDLKSSQLTSLIRGRVNEAERVRRNAVVLPYFWFRYRDGGYFSEEDLKTALSTLYKSNASGFIMWGSSNDVNTIAKCNDLQEYLEKTMGPAIAEYTKPNMKLRDHLPITLPNIESTSNSEYYNIESHLDPDFYWIPPENYTEDIEKYVEEEIKKKLGYNLTDINDKTNSNLNDSVLINKLINYFKENSSVLNTEDKEIPFEDLTTVSYEDTNDLETSQSIENSVYENSNNSLDVRIDTTSINNKVESYTIPNTNETSSTNSESIFEDNTKIYESTIDNQSKLTLESYLTTEQTSIEQLFYTKTTVFREDFKESQTTDFTTEAIIEMKAQDNEITSLKETEVTTANTSKQNTKDMLQTTTTAIDQVNVYVL